MNLSVFGQENVNAVYFTNFRNAEGVKDWLTPHGAYKLDNGNIALALLQKDREGSAKPDFRIYDFATKKNTIFKLEGLTDVYRNDLNQIEFVVGSDFYTYNDSTKILEHLFTGSDYFTYDKFAGKPEDETYSIYTIDYKTRPEGVKQWWGMRVYDYKNENEYELQDFDFGYNDPRGTGTRDYNNIKAYKNNHFYMLHANTIIKLNIDGLIKGTSKKDYAWTFDITGGQYGSISLKTFHYDQITKNVILITHAYSGMYLQKEKKFNGYDEFHIHLVNPVDGKLKSSKSLLPQTPEFTEEENGRKNLTLHTEVNEMIFGDTYFSVLMSYTYSKGNSTFTNFEIIKFDYTGKIISRHPVTKQDDPFVGSGYKAGLLGLADNNYVMWHWLQSGWIDFYEVKL